MFNVDTYLKVIGFAGTPDVTLETLRQVQKHHMTTVPFDNSVNAGVDRGLDVWADVDIDGDETFERIVVGGQGGVCYELNGLFRMLLQGLGFDYHILAGAVRQMDGGFGPDLEHIFGCVRLGGDLWLVDVGIAGPSYLEPLRLGDEVQEQYGVQYQVVESDGYRVIQRRPKGGEWRPIYRFHLRFRDISEWHDPDPKLVEFPPGMIAVGTYIHSRAVENGQWVMIGRRFLRVEDGHEQMKVLVDTQAYRDTAAMILNRES